MTHSAPPQSAAPSSPAGAATPAAFWQSREADRFFRRFVLSVTVLLLTYTSIRWAIDGDLRRAVSPLIIGIGGVLAMLIRRRGNTYAAFLCYVWITWLALTLQGLLRAGIDNPALHGYLALVLAAGWMLGWRQALGVAAAAAAATLAMALAAQFGGWQPAPQMPPLYNWISLLIVWAVGLIVLGMVIGAQRDFQARTQLLNAELRRQIDEREQAQAELRSLNEALEERVTERTGELQRSNAELSNALDTVHRTQEELLHAEKLASLGQLVAGVAHELNTPIGNALTASTTVSGVTREFLRIVEDGALRRSDLTRFTEQVSDGALLIERSLYRAAELLTSFKQVAIDQASERRRRFDLARTVHEVVDTLRPTLKGQPWRIEVDIPAGVMMESYPGPLDQIVINLVMNASIHAFDGRSEGRVRLYLGAADDERVELVCEDDGVGIAAENLARIFDPFYTSRLGRGGSGLGLTITHRLATQLLGGQVRVDSTPGVGTRFILTLPRSAPEAVA